MAGLTSRSYLHLMPEEAGGQFLSPFFARVVSIERDTVRFRGLEGGEGTVSRSVASSRTVSAAMVNKVGHVSPCRQPVLVTTSTQFLHGQVTRVNVDGVTVESDGTEVEVAFDNVKEVAPVVALLLQQVVFEKSVWSSGEVSEIHVTILDRVLGRGGCTATRDVSGILDGLIEEKCFPEGQSDCAWIDPQSGQNTRFSLQHAVDFAYYIDGMVDRGHEMVGSSFCVPPPDDGINTGENQGSKAHEGPLATDDECQIFDPFADDDVQLADESTRATARPQSRRTASSKRNCVTAMVEEDVGPAFQRPRLVESSPDVDKDAFIVDRLQADPVLLNRFLQIRETSTTRIDRPAPDVTNPPLDASPATKPSKPADAKTKYAFAPSQERRVVHEKLTAERYRGKDPAVYVTSQIRSEAVLCKSLPGMLTRAFDWGFNIEGLSITHFKFMDRKQRMQWINSGGANFENFSATADFEPAPRVTTILEVVEAARVFSSFAREFCVSSAVELIDTIIAFIEAKVIRMRWDPNDVMEFVYWVNDVLEKFRSAIAGCSHIEPSQVHQRCRLEDHLFREIRQDIHERRVQELEQKAATPPLVQATTRNSIQSLNHSPASRTRGNRKGHGPIPPKVLQRLPKYHDAKSGATRRLCMRFLSVSGCQSEDLGKGHDGRAHFVQKHSMLLSRQKLRSDSEV